MQNGRILVASEAGVYDIKLIGDVRMVLCASLSRYIESIFRKGDATEVLVDLCEAEGVDSTTLGLLAKLAIYCNCNFSLRPKLFCPDEGIFRTLTVMGLDDVFEMHTQSYGGSLDDSAEELCCGDEDPEEYRQKVIEAHRLLIELNPSNRDDFIDLLNALEAE